MAWWHSQDEERWNGPFSDREEAISEGQDEYNGESFMVLEAEVGSYDLRPDADRLLEMLDGLNEDRGDPDGDPPFTETTTEQAKALEKAVGDAIEAWAVAQGINTRAWSFENQGKPETIPEAPETEEPPLLNRQS